MRVVDDHGERRFLGVPADQAQGRGTDGEPIRWRAGAAGVRPQRQRGGERRLLRAGDATEAGECGAEELEECTEGQFAFALGAAGSEDTQSTSQ